MEVAVVYGIKCKVTKQMYVGATTTSLNQRWLAHRSLLRNGHHPCVGLQSAWTAYGESQFVLQSLAEVSVLAGPSELRRVEREWIARMHKKGKALNTRIHAAEGLKRRAAKTIGRRIRVTAFITPEECERFMKAQRPQESVADTLRRALELLWGKDEVDGTANRSSQASAGTDANPS